MEKSTPVIRERYYNMSENRVKTVEKSGDVCYNWGS